MKREKVSDYKNSLMRIVYRSRDISFVRLIVDIYTGTQSQCKHTYLVSYSPFEAGITRRATSACVAPK